MGECDPSLGKPYANGLAMDEVLEEARLLPILAQSGRPLLTLAV